MNYSAFIHITKLKDVYHCEVFTIMQCLNKDTGRGVQFASEITETFGHDLHDNISLIRVNCMT